MQIKLCKLHNAKQIIRDKAKTQPLPQVIRTQV